MEPTKLAELEREVKKVINSKNTRAELRRKAEQELTADLEALKKKCDTEPNAKTFQKLTETEAALDRLDKMAKADASSEIDWESTEIPAYAGAVRVEAEQYQDELLQVTLALAKEYRESLDNLAGIIAQLEKLQGFTRGMEDQLQAVRNELLPKHTMPDVYGSSRNKGKRLDFNRGELYGMTIRGAYGSTRIEDVIHSLKGDTAARLKLI